MRAENHGFTLAELAVVLLLLGMLMVAVIPRFSYVSGGERLRAAARRLVGMALQSHSEAVTKSRPFFLCLDFEEKSVWLSSVRPGNEGDAGIESRVYTLPRDVNFVDAIHPSDGLVKEGRVSFGYWSQGGNEPGTIHLETEDGEEMTIFIRPYMGHCEVEEGYLREDYS
jgi:prepilin-type N-terminal cleavage/methylation domain-containing protein